MSRSPEWIDGAVKDGYHFLEKVVRTAVKYEGASMLQPDHIQKIKEFCSKHPSIAAAYIFGSVATGKDRKGSDIDVAVMVKSPVSAMERIEMETAVSNLLHRDVDLVIFHLGSTLLQRQVLMYGHLIYEADPQERVRQEVFARRAYLDTAFLYRKLRRDPPRHG